MRKKYKTLVFIKNLRDPSAYYRLGQYLEELVENEDVKYICYASDWMYSFYYDSNKVNRFFKKALFALSGLIRVTIYIIWDIFINHSDIVIINRKIFPRVMPIYGGPLLNIYLKKRKTYWDFDDNIIFDKEITLIEERLLSEYSELIVVTNEFLKNTINNKNLYKVKLLPTTDSTFQSIDLKSINEKRVLSYTNIINIVWVGTKDNLPYVYKILSYLDQAAKKVKILSGKQIQFSVVCNDMVRYPVKDLIIKNIKWTRDIANQMLLTSHIGIMPLEDSEYTRGKGGFKAIQYLSAGLPCIISNVGFNKEIIQDEINGYQVNKDVDWINKIVALSTHADEWIKMSVAARDQWQSNFSSESNNKFWNELLKGD